MENFLNATIDFWVNEADPRTRNLLLVRTPWTIISILVIYFTMLYYIIPAAFKNQKHQQYRQLLSIYYVFHSSLSIFCIAAWVLIAIKIKFNFRCHPIDYSDSLWSNAIIIYTDLFLWFKFTEMFESFLLAVVNGKAPIFNILHHTIYPIMLAIGARFYPGGSPAFFPLVNCFEHALLYSVLAIRQMSSKFKKNCTWFKKFHIILSILAMVVSIVYYIQMETRDDCNFNTFRIYILICLFLFCFFGIYFRWSYIMQDDAFGNTWVVKAIHKAKKEGKAAMMISRGISSEKNVETKLIV